MDTYEILALMGFLILLGLVLSLQVWWRRHRSHETLRQKKQEDKEIEIENQIW